MVDAKRTSETALFAALCRATAALDHGGADGLGTDHLALNFLPPHLRFLLRFAGIRARVRNKNAVMTPGGYEYLPARTAWFDSVFARAINDAVPQVVLIGAGYDTRSCRFPVPAEGIRLFELDMPAMQTRKRKCLTKAGLTPPTALNWVPLDLTRASPAESLANAGFDPAVQTVFLAEGITMYLDADAMGATLDLVTNAGPGSRIAFDYVTTTSADSTAFGVREFMATWNKHRTGEPFTFTSSDDALTQLITAHGLQSTRVYTDTAIHDAWLTRDIGPVTGFFRFAEACQFPATP